MSQKVIFKTVEFLNGDKCDVLVPTVAEYSRAMEKYNKQPKSEDGFERLDLNPFLIEQICLFNGEKKDIPFIVKLSGDVYFKLMPVFDELLNMTL